MFGIHVRVGAQLAEGLSPHTVLGLLGEPPATAAIPLRRTPTRDEPDDFAARPPPDRNPPPPRRWTDWSRPSAGALSIRAHASPSVPKPRPGANAFSPIAASTKVARRPPTWTPRTCSAARCCALKGRRVRFRGQGAGKIHRHRTSLALLDSLRKCTSRKSAGIIEPTSSPGRNGDQARSPTLTGASDLEFHVGHRVVAVIMNFLRHGARLGVRVCRAG